MTVGQSVTGRPSAGTRAAIRAAIVFIWIIFSFSSSVSLITHEAAVCSDGGGDPPGEKAGIGDGRARVRGGAVAIVDGGLRSVMTLRSVI